MKSYIIHFIRHGAIDETLSGKYIGTTDVPLSEKGRLDLKKLDYEYRYPGTQVVFTSPLKRCTETCKILYPELNPLSITALSECNFGEWEGKTAEELKNDPDFEKWLAGDNSVKPPRGESNADFTRRICRMFESIVEGLMKTGTTESVIVTHGGVIMTLLAVYGLPQAKPFEWTMDNGFGYSLRVTPMLWQRDKVCEVFRTIPMEQETD
ncbi:histidine phosphatase family protein [Ruminococcus sp.]|uniref:histidine phosphatase family protein n=1 Tax=Ruminococcus sp. TaxID=41978 RepID=UPI00260F64F4|nr:histidine phosphatase family protein [Ruminococcus sp.]MDD6989687.1 histidine phosphatase family protein [Ruminococcus sp.]MDY6201826.1 histidine phosphatase family protein [Ruminococcus sp.]